MAVAAAQRADHHPDPVRRSIDRAIAFLLRARTGPGWWLDFDVAGSSDAWVSAYVGATLAGCHVADGWSAARRAWDLLARRSWWSAGWGYNARVPPDADTTAWALMLAQRVGAVESFRARRGRRFLAQHVQSNGGIATYRLLGPIRAFTGLEARFAGWTAAHTCVTAVAGSVLGAPSTLGAIDYLRGHQEPEGSWRGYWWHDREFATAWAVDALAATGRPDDQQRIERAAEWALGRIAADGPVRTSLYPDGSPSATALACRIVAQCKRMDGTASCGAALEWLLRAQRADGSWEPSARLRVPPPDLADVDSLPAWGQGGQGVHSIGNVVCDRGIHTTATVLSALAPRRI